MKIVWDNSRNEQVYYNHRGEGDPFEQHVEHTRAFRLAYADTDPVEAEARRSLIRLLNLIPIYGRVVLPKNSQN